MRRDGTAPKTLGIFPLTGTMVLPGTFLPLNIFEQRYRNLVADALEADRRIGMIQPLVPAEDNLGPVPGGPECPELYTVGCTGTITQWHREPDGRFLIVLEGRQRFEVLEELKLHRGYRRVRARFFDEERDGSGRGSSPPLSLLEAALKACRRWEIQIDPDVLAALPEWRLVNVLAVSLPFSAAEKQLLLEAQNPDERAKMLLQLLDLETGCAVSAAATTPPN